MSWNARWIWARGEAAPRNVVMNFRCALEYKDADRAAQLHISADSRYILYVNGTRLGYGPARAYQFNYQYDTYPLADYLTAGKNVIAVSVLHWGEGNFQSLVGRGGLLVQLNDGHLLASDANWRVKRNNAYRQDVLRISPQLAWEEQYDARRGDAGWTGIEFDDSTWENAIEIGAVGVAPWTHLSPRMVPLLSDEPLLPVRVTARGEMSRPNLTASIHMTPYVAPGDVSANQQRVDALITSILHVPESGQIIFKKCTTYRKPPDVLLDGAELIWEPDTSDYRCERFVQSGEHLLLLDWQARINDLDFSLASSGMSGLAFTSPFAGEIGTWAIALDPGAARATVRAAKTTEEMQCEGIQWKPVAPIDSPPVDVYMDMTASQVVNTSAEPVTLPLTIAPAGLHNAKHYLVDFGREVIGWIELDVEAQAGAVVDFLGFEGMKEGVPQITQLMNNTLRYTCRTGRQTYTSVVRRGLRYLLLAVHGTEANVILHSILVRQAAYPGLVRGSFACSDPRLNQIWEMSAYTMRLCSEDTFTDCPAYEQTMWVGDAFTDTLIHQMLYADRAYIESNLKLVADSLQRMPIANSQVPSAWEDYPIPNWSLMWMMACRTHYQFTGDASFVRAVYPALAKQARFIADSRNGQGLFAMSGAWHFLDWTKLDTAPDYIMAHENCLAIVALRDTAALAEIAGEEPAAAQWRTVAAEMAEAVNRVFWSDAAQAYVDSVHDDGTLSQTISQPTNVCALFADITPPARAELLRPYVIRQPKNWVGTGSPFMMYFNGAVLAQSKRWMELLQVIRERWGEMLDVGATTTWETFRGFAAGQDPRVYTRSWCHAWSATPVYFLSAFILGVRPLEAGFTCVLIEPQLGDLEWVRGHVPTRHGLVGVQSEQIAGRLRMLVELPPEVSAQVRLPDSGRRIQVSGGTSLVAYPDNTRIIELPKGACVEITME